jgi:integrase
MDRPTKECKRFRFTQKTIESLPAPAPGGKAHQAEYSDIEVVGLRVVVGPNGRKFFDYRFRYNMRKRAMRIGEFPAVSLKEARERANEFKNMLWRGIDPAVERRKRITALTFAEFAKAYLEHAKARKRTWKNDEQKLRRELIPAWGRLPLSAITGRDVQAVHNRIGTQSSPAHANRHLALIHRLFALAVDWGHLPPDHRNPAQSIRKFRENNARERYLSGEEIARFIAALDARPERVTANAIKLLLFTGMRRGEAISLKWDCVDRERGTLFLPLTKSGKSRTVVLNSLALGVIDEMAEMRVKGHPYVFPGKNRGEHLAEPRKTFEGVRDALGLGDLHLHDLRHTFASVAVQNGASLFEVQKLLGHASSQMTQRYAHLGDASMRAVTDGVAAQMSRQQE